MGNGHCVRVTNPHLKSKSQVNFGNFTKWAEAIPMAIQTATTITRELVKVLSFIRDITLGPESQLQKQFVTTNTGCIWYY